MFDHNHTDGVQNPSVQSVHSFIETDILSTSTAIFVYDTTPTAPFGSSLDERPNGPRVYQMETRPGAGSSFVGYVDRLAHSSAGVDFSSGPFSVIGSACSFLQLAPSILALPAPKHRAPVNLHLSLQSSHLDSDRSTSSSLVQVPELDSVLQGLEALVLGGYSGVVIFSENARQAASVSTSLTHKINYAGLDLVSIFDGLSVGRLVSDLSPVQDQVIANGVSKGDSIKDTIKTSVPFFTYTGSPAATQVVVLPASVYSAVAKSALALAFSEKDIGILTVYVVNPWSTEEFAAALPSTTKVVHVLGNKSTTFLSDTVLSSIVESGLSIKSRQLIVQHDSVPTVDQWIDLFAPLVTKNFQKEKTLLSEACKLVSFWSIDSSAGQAEEVPSSLVETFGANGSGITPALYTTYDNYRLGGIRSDTLLLETKQTNVYPLGAIAQSSPASLLFISNAATVLRAYHPISSTTVDSKTRIILSANWTAEELSAKLPLAVRQTLAGIASPQPLTVIDIEKIAKDNNVSSKMVTELVFWDSYFPNFSVRQIQDYVATTSSFKNYKVDAETLSQIHTVIRNSFIQAPVLAEWADEVPEGELVTLPSILVPTAAGPNPDRVICEPPITQYTWKEAAKRLMYPEAYSLVSKQEDVIRPDLDEKNYIVKVSEFRRLTPDTYDRNVFHIEFDLAGTGLKYAVGEALGVHGWNDAAETQEFLYWYGINGTDLVNIPSRKNPEYVEQRTAFQIFQQNLDLFGKPGKSFYEFLSKHAQDIDEKRALQFIGSPEGSSTFKKMCDVDTVTYFDVMKMYPSAKPPISELVKAIEEIEPRHYSIASSQNFVGDSVHLLVVAVDWVDPKGVLRYGHCTRYLNSLKAGDQVTVSVKPSVMKLPPSDMAPIVMAGLGTGAAPFRAFIQERAYRKTQGTEVGPLIYYFGSRYRAAEYLYGEEIEAYLQEGIVTHTGLAFSRDTDQKVYIQHKMNQDAALLAQSMEAGSFFLCGPTWPVPSVFKALVQAFVSTGKSLEEAEAHIESLKEKERYVLEVY